MDLSAMRWHWSLLMTSCVSLMTPKLQWREVKQLKLKNDRIQKPENYLGAQVMQEVIDGREWRAMTSEQYVKAAIANVEAALGASGQWLPSKATTPIHANYRA
jgi:hypothetical protein